MGMRQAILDGKMMEVERAQAAAQEARRVLRRLLSKHFAELGSLPEIDAISNVDALESIIDSVFDANDAGSIRTAILAAAGPT